MASLDLSDLLGTVSRPDLTDADLASISASFETAAPGRIIRWAVEEFGTRLSLAASMTDAVLIDMAVQADAGIEVVFIDTGYHFPETLATVEEVRRRYGLNLRMMTVAHQEEALWQADPENCCSAVKVGQLDRALADKDAWMSGLRRAESPTRANAPIVGRDIRGLVKINPLATWSDLDIQGYIADHGIITNPLLDQGYPSIGCMPCTSRVEPGADPRSGRWAGRDKSECGLHI